MPFTVQHKCRDQYDEPERDTLAMVRREEDGVIMLVCTNCNEDFWIVDRDAYDLWKGSRIESGTTIPGFVIPGIKS